MMIEEQCLKLVPETEISDEPKKPETLYPNEYVLARENPFLSLSWRRWEELQARAVQSLSAFLLAAERLLPQLIILHALSLQEVALELYKEACLWVPPLSQSVREDLRERRTRRGPQNDTSCDPDIYAEDNCDGSCPSPFYDIRRLPWRKLQADMIQNLTDFLVAAASKKPAQLMSCAVAIHELALQCQREAGLWVAFGVAAMDGHAPASTQ